MMETDQALLNHYLERETSNNSEDAGEEIIDAGLISDLVRNTRGVVSAG